MADTKISALAAVGTPAGTDEFAVNQSGTSKKETLAQIKTFVSDATVFAAGSASASTKPKLTSGTILTAAEAGAMEFDGAGQYFTHDTTSGRAQSANMHLFRLNANAGAGIGPAIANFFGTNSAFPTVAGAHYELEATLYHQKTTAATCTYTITNTQTYTQFHGIYTHTAINTAIGSFGAISGAALQNTTAAAAAFPITGSLATAVIHCCRIIAYFEIGTAGNIRINFTSTSGTTLPLKGSYYTVRRVFPGNIGTYVA